MVKNILRKLRNISSRQLLVASAFTVAMAGAVGLGLATKQISKAATIRECTTNSIDYANENGGCGAQDPQEYIADLRTNVPGDLQTIAKNFTPDFHLDASEYNDFAAHAVEGTAYKDGHVVVDGQTVLNDAWSIGRHVKGYSHEITIPGAGVFHASRSQDVFAVNSIPVMVYFNNQGVVQFIAMNPCGNLMAGTKVVPTATCKALNATQSKANPNEYTFTTTADFAGNASLSRVVYTFSDTGETVTTTSLSAPVDHIFHKSGTVTVKVYAKVPGGHEIVASIVNCSKKITFTPPIATCVELQAAALDDQKRNFRFTVIAKTDQYSKLVSADFTLDNTTTVTGVTDKNAQGNIYRDYNFTDGVTHTVVAKVNFTTLEGATSVTCKASVTPTKPPMCTVPGHENLPPNSPQCAYCAVPGFENLPADSPNCKETTPTPPAPVLPNTGPGNLFGIFTGTTAAGAAAHRMFSSRRRRNRD